MYRKVFLTGGTGFVGTEILRELARNKYKVKVLTHSQKPKVQSKLVEVVKGSVLDTDSLDSVKGCDMIIHLVGIIREIPWKGVTFEKLHVEATRNMIKAAKANKIKRFIHMSANGAKPKGTRYQTTKYRAEQLVKNSGLNYTIFRPSFIWGDTGGLRVQLGNMMKRFPLIPYFGDGNYKFQPVSIKTVAEAFVKSINNRKAFNKIYHLGGPKVYTYKELLDIIAEKTGRKTVKIPIPMWVARIAVTLLDWLPQFPITNDQLTMLLDGNVCGSSEATRDLKIKSYSFR